MNKDINNYVLSERTIIVLQNIMNGFCLGKTWVHLQFDIREDNLEGCKEQHGSFNAARIQTICHSSENHNKEHNRETEIE